LANAAPLEVGAFVYDLSLGDCATQADQNWYLCSTGQAGTTATLFESMPSILLDTFARPETLQERLAQRINGQNTQSDVFAFGAAPSASEPAPQQWTTWLRAWGDYADIKPGSSTSGSSWDASNWGLQIGIDTPIGNLAGGELIFGTNLRYARTNADTLNAVGEGRIEAEGFGIGSTLTWYGHDGLYVDTQAMAYWVTTDAWSSAAGVLLDGQDNMVYSLSGEAGKRFEFGEGIAVMPQMQVAWGSLDGGNFTDALGNVVVLGDNNSLIGRTGVTLERIFAADGGGDGKVYTFGNVLHDFGGDRTVTVAGTDLVQSSSGTWGEIGGGFNLPAGTNTNLFAQASYRQAFSGVDGEAVSVSGGIRVSW
jgi:outer membrane autotransporter protein